MNLNVIATLSLTAALAFGALDTSAQESQRTPEAALAQASRDAASGATGNDPQGIGLTADHKRIIYNSIAGEQGQTLSSDPQVGGTIPDSVILNAMPIAVKDQVGGLLRDFKFVKLTGDKILIVDPASREIVDIITKDAGR